MQIMTLEQLLTCQARKIVVVTRRWNGACDVPGVLLLATAAIPQYGIPAVAFVEFADGVEHVAPEWVQLGTRQENLL